MKESTCRVCDKVKLESDFDKMKSGRRRRTCKKCRSSNRVRKATRRRWRLLKRYGVTEEWVRNLWELQKRRCALCRDRIDLYHRLTGIDHCHASGQVRGLLCHRCNLALGLFRDDVKVLRRAAEYVARHQAAP